MFYRPISFSCRFCCVNCLTHCIHSFPIGNYGNYSYNDAFAIQWTHQTFAIGNSIRYFTNLCDYDYLTLFQMVFKLPHWLISDEKLTVCIIFIGQQLQRKHNWIDLSFLDYFVLHFLIGVCFSLSLSLPFSLFRGCHPLDAMLEKVQHFL